MKNTINNTTQTNSKRLNFKLIIFSLICFINLNIYAQQTNYSGGVAYTIIFNEQGEILKEIPMGKDVLITYDEFYNSYSIMMNVQDGMMGFDLRYVKTDNKGKIFKDAKNSNNPSFYVNNNLSNQEKIFILMKTDKQELDGKSYIIVYQFNDFKKTYKTNN